jgi:hypothetical protein
MRQLDPQRRDGVGAREPAAPVLICVPDLNPPRRPLEVAPRPKTPPREEIVSETVVPPRLDASSKTTAFDGAGSFSSPAPQARADEPLAPPDEAEITPLPQTAAPPTRVDKRPSLREKLSGSSSGRVPPLAVLAGVLVAGVFLGMTMLRGGSDEDADAGPALPAALTGEGAAAAGGMAPPYAPPRIELDPSLKLRAESPAAPAQPPETTATPETTASAETPAAPREPAAEPDSMPWPRPTNTSAAAEPRGPVYQARRPAAEFEGTIAKPR